MSNAEVEIHNLKAEIAKLKCENRWLKLAYEDEKKRSGKRGRDLIILRKRVEKLNDR